MKKTAITILALLLCTFLFACDFSLPQTKDNVSTSIETNSSTEKSQSSSSSSNVKEESFPQNADTDPSEYIFQGYIELGYYPQTIAHHKAVKSMSAVTDATGYYWSDYDDDDDGKGDHYVKISKAKVYGLKYKFSEDTIIEENATYYFKVQPVKWKVFRKVSLSTDNKIQLYLISDMILDSHEFCTNYTLNIMLNTCYRDENPTVLANSWAYSDVRSYLNGDFLDNLFKLDDSNKSLLLSRETSRIFSDFDALDNHEYLWAPSLEEVQKLKDNTALTSDYARVRSTFMSIYPDYYGNGRYWTSTAGNNSYRVAVVTDNTTLSSSGESVGSTFIGVRPVISVYAEDVAELLKQE